MSESSSEDTERRPTPDIGLVDDEQLPEDLQPEKNPLARDPDDEPSESDDDSNGPKVDGMPDMGSPGAS